LVSHYCQEDISRCDKKIENAWEEKQDRQIEEEAPPEDYPEEYLENSFVEEAAQDIGFLEGHGDIQVHKIRIDNVQSPSAVVVLIDGFHFRIILRDKGAISVFYGFQGILSGRDEEKIDPQIVCDLALAADSILVKDIDGRQRNWRPRCFCRRLCPIPFFSFREDDPKQAQDRFLENQPKIAERVQLEEDREERESKSRSDGPNSSGADAGRYILCGGYESKLICFVFV